MMYSRPHEGNDEERVAVALGVLLHGGNHLLALSLCEASRLKLLSLEVLNFLVKVIELQISNSVGRRVASV